MTDISLLPPSATPFERTVSSAGARIADVPVTIASLWNPLTCPIALLPWLAWAVATDSWNSDWADSEKRQAVLNSIGAHQVKGSRATVEAVLAGFDSLLELVEWFEATPALDPYTFEVRLPLVDEDGGTGGPRVTTDFALAVIADVSRVKPVRAHFEFVQTLVAESVLAGIGGAEATLYRRLDMEAAAPPDPPAGEWADMLQDENGEPLDDDAGEYVDGSSA